MIGKCAVHYEVTNASLTKFDLTGDSTFLDYNLTLNITLENPSPLNYNFNQLAAMPVFKNQTLNDMTNLSTSFYLEHETNAMFPVLFSGNSLVVFGAQEAFDFRNASVFDIVLKINSQYWAKSKKKKITFKQEMACYLKVPLNSNRTSSACDSFQITKCEETKLDIDVD
ncbi:hypothetical protein M0R45_028826 [Rubus argutus]|uniref:Late embryogenesis abundant protein LEA-2 subgroup domain-containing protein n=1 Tax=Rubus argutus TaxID=59490 RepID=A0AAW1W8E9_RUBAR